MTPLATTGSIMERWGIPFFEKGFGSVIRELRPSPIPESVEREVALLARVKELAQVLKHEYGVAFPDAVAVEEYLVRFPDTHLRVHYLAHALRNVLGARVRFTLDINRDPEIDDPYLVLLVQLPSYDTQTYERIRSVRSVVNRSLPPGEGRVLATTDFL